MVESIAEPREVDDEIYVKFLMLYKRWLAVDDLPESQDEIKGLYPLQVKPKRTIWYVDNFFNNVSDCIR